MQDTRLPTHQTFNTTQIFRNEALLQAEINKLVQKKQKGLVILRGLPGSGKTEFARKLSNVIIFSVTSFLAKDEDGKLLYTTESIRKAHQKMKKEIEWTLKTTKSCDPIVVDAPHVYLWELKYYRIQAQQLGYKFMIYEVRTLLPHDATERQQLLNDININKMIGEIVVWLQTQKKRNNLLPSQMKLLSYLTMDNAVEVLKETKSSNDSFMPTILLNIQLVAWLTARSPNGIYMDMVWNMLSEWEEVTSDDDIWRHGSPKWGW